MRQEIYEILSQIEGLVSELKRQLSGPGIHEIQVVVISQQGLYYAHIWDGEKNSHPRVINLSGGLDKESAVKKTTMVLNHLMTNPSSIKKHKTITWISDIKWSELPEVAQEFKKIINLVELEVSDELRAQIEWEHNKC